MCPWRNDSQAGFTLVTTVTVVAVVTVVCALLIVSLSFYMPSYRLSSVVQELDIQFQAARVEAIYRKDVVAVSFFTGRSGEPRKYGPVVWVDSNYDPSNPAHPLLEDGEDVLFKMPVTQVKDSVWEYDDFGGIRFDHAQSGADGIGDGVTFDHNAFVLNRWGESDQAGSIFLTNARGGKREILIELNGKVKIR